MIVENAGRQGQHLFIYQLQALARSEDEFKVGMFSLRILSGLEQMKISRSLSTEAADPGFLKIY